MTKEQVYKLIKAQGFLPGVTRWRVGSLNEHEDQTDRIKFTTPKGGVYVVEYHTHTDAKRTLSDVFDIIEINPKDQLLRG
ncbi:hypothetical protein RCIP0012_00102 [Klebsiella phage RCIP0012]